MSMLGDFKAFAMRGNVIDLAVGLVIGAAFGKIVTSLVTDIISPPLGLLIGGIDFSGLSVTLRQAVGDAPAVTLNYGIFIQTIISFIIVAFAIFLVVRVISKMQRQQEAVEEKTPVPTGEEKLLAEIRDLLSERKTPV